MPEMLKGWLSIFIHFVIGLGCCLIYVFFFKKIDVLPQFLLSRKLAETGILFIRIMPSLLVSAILIGYAVIFGTCGQNTVPRFSDILLRYLKKAFIMLFSCITIYIILIEIISPLLVDYRRYSELKTQDYYDFIKETDISLRNGDAEKAYDKAKAALGIWKNNPEALQLFDKAKISYESYNAERKQNNKIEQSSETVEPENLTAEGALFISKRFMNKYDFYTAHYYAMRAYQLSAENAPYREEALRLAAQAWNQIEKGIAELTAEFDIRLYQAKKAGYEMLQQGNYIKAYYQFVNAKRMLEQNNPFKKDPDIDRFIDITRKKVLEEVFFIDETASLPLLETVRNIHFTVPASGTRASAQITIEGLSYITNNGIKEIYGRNCELTQYAADGKILYRSRIPFIKLIPIESADGVPMLRMLFRAVDKQRDAVVLKPFVLEGTMPIERQTSLRLPFSYNDFQLIIAANEGEKSMTLPQLYAFRQRGAQYGFPAQIYHRELLARIIDVFLIWIISIYMLVLAWRFRVPPHRQFKHTWALAFPFFFVLATGLVEAGRYCARLIIALLTDISYSLSPLLLLLAYTLCFIGMCFFFIGQRSEV
ncbi:hypothetical protein ABK01_00540 [Treponema sp. OMZ 305]|uniref:hypothetical protein n=1 Tax=Treponema sp. OMZ 305 TaxID=1659192 RepID=UPI0020A61BE1|nr:hypothetical protein [Treponema sp. OMZ 305]UTC56904.1 hypothetical protein ABK01_00540 [Treponema sp. OMZ 305]